VKHWLGINCIMYCP